MKKKLYQAIAGAVQARQNCKGKTEPHLIDWLLKHSDRAEKLCSDYMPSGAGVDSGTKIDWEKTTPEKLVFATSFHHIDENGYYDGWTHHAITVKASLVYGIVLTISGKDRNDVKDYLHEVFNEALREEIEEYPREEESEAIAVNG